ncbi:MAG: DUF2975 domain-containing protein [Halopseudomonas aestusnigri]
MFKFLSPFLAPLSRLLAIGFLLLNGALWFGGEFAEFPARAYSGMAETDFNLGLNNRIFGVLISSIHLGVLCYGLWAVAKIFSRLNTGTWYIPEFSQCLRRFGLSLVVFTLMIPLVQALMSLALTYDNEVGERLIVLDVDASTAPISFVLLLIGVLLSLMAGVLVRAREVAEEYEKIV